MEDTNVVIKINKQLIIMVFYINVRGLTRQRAEEQVYELMKNQHCQFETPEIMENYIIRTIFLPVEDKESDVKIIYPVSGQSENDEVLEFIKELEEKFCDSIDKNAKEMASYWKKTYREMKLKKLNGA